MTGADLGARLVAVLEEGQRYGYLGPGPVERHIDHSLALGRAVGRWEAGALDLGSGAGVPGLVLAVSEPTSRWVLLDSSARRTRFLETAVAELGLASRVTVLRERAEEAARRAELREAFAVVTARSFGPPPVVAECGSALTAVGGRLVVSEPPEPGPQRWPEGPLADLGLRRAPATEDDEVALVVLEKVAPSPQWVPRRTGRPAKRPLF